MGFLLFAQEASDATSNNAMVALVVATFTGIGLLIDKGIVFAKWLSHQRSDVPGNAELTRELRRVEDGYEKLKETVGSIATDVAVIRTRVEQQQK